MHAVKRDSHIFEGAQVRSKTQPADILDVAICDGKFGQIGVKICGNVKKIFAVASAFDFRPLVLRVIVAIAGEVIRVLFVLHFRDEEGLGRDIYSFSDENHADEKKAN